MFNFGQFEEKRIILTQGIPKLNYKQLKKSIRALKNVSEFQTEHHPQMEMFDNAIPHLNLDQV